MSKSPNAEKQLLQMLNEAEHFISLISEYQQYPELHLFVSRPEIVEAIPIPLGERAQLLHFLSVIWHRARSQAQRLLELYHREQVKGNKG